MRSIKALALLFTLIIPLLGTWAWLTYHKSEVRHSVKHRMLQELLPKDLVTFNFTQTEMAEELEWEHSEEFEYNGSMYDVIEKKLSGDIVTFICWPDNQETELNQWLDNVVSQLLGQDPVKNNREQNLMTFYRSLFFQEISIFQLVSFQLVDQEFLEVNLKEIIIDFAPITPPPQS